MECTGCNEEQARTASRSLTLLGEVKGTALSMPPAVKDYMAQRLAVEAAEIFETETE